MILIRSPRYVKATVTSWPRAVKPTNRNRTSESDEFASSTVMRRLVSTNAVVASRNEEFRHRELGVAADQPDRIRYKRLAT